MSKKIDHKTISDTLDISVHHEEGWYNVFARNKSSTEKMALRVNFAGCINMLPKASGDIKIINNNITEVMIPPNTESLAGTLLPVNPKEKYSYSYTCATKMLAHTQEKAPSAAPKAEKAEKSHKKPKNYNGGKPTPAPAGVDDSERKDLCEKLDIIINSINNGYSLMVDNLHETATYTVTLNLEESQNLKIEPVGKATLEGKSIKIVVAPYTYETCVDMPVENMDLGSCELRYKALIKKS